MLTSKICYYLFGVKPLIGAAIVFLWLAFGKKIGKLFNNKFFRILFVSLPAIIIFIRILVNDPFFLSDDFDHLRFVYGSSYFGMLQIVLSRSGFWVGHHMILGFWVFKFIYDLFGTNIYPYVTVTFLLNLASTLTFFVVSGEFIKNNFVRTTVTFLFGFLYLSWISNIHELLGAIFLMLGLYAFMKWIKNRKITYGFLTILFYILGIFTKEITFLLFPFMIMIYLYLRKWHILKKDLKVLAPLALIFGLYSIFYASTFLGYFGQASGYKMGFDPIEIFYNLAFYLKYVLPGIGSFFNLALVMLAALYGYCLYRKDYWPAIFLSGFLIFISPVLLFSDRVSSYYGYIPVIFLFVSFGKIGELFRFIKKPVLAVLVAAVFLYVFLIDKVLMDNCFLIVAPWPNQTRQQFLSLISDVKRFESGGQKTAKFDLNDKSGELIANSGVGVVPPFLDRHAAGLYDYTYDNIHNILIVEKK